MELGQEGRQQIRWKMQPVTLNMPRKHLAGFSKIARKISRTIFEHQFFSDQFYYPPIPPPPGGRYVSVERWS